MATPSKQAKQRKVLYTKSLERLTREAAQLQSVRIALDEFVTIADLLNMPEVRRRVLIWQATIRNAENAILDIINTTTPTE